MKWVSVLSLKPQLQRVPLSFSFKGLHHWFAPKRHFTVLNTPHLWGLCFCSDCILMILSIYFRFIEVTFVIIHIKHGTLELIFHRRRKMSYLSYEDLENKNTLKLAIGDSFHLYLVSGLFFIDFMKYENAVKTCRRN